MRHLRWNGRPDIDFFRDARFAKFRQSLDSEMKRIQSLGIGTKKKQAEVLTEEEEELLWTEGQHLSHSLTQSSFTVVCTSHWEVGESIDSLGTLRARLSWSRSLVRDHTWVKISLKIMHRVDWQVGGGGSGRTRRS